MNRGKCRTRFPKYLLGHVLMTQLTWLFPNQLIMGWSALALTNSPSRNPLIHSQLPWSWSWPDLYLAERRLEGIHLANWANSGEKSGKISGLAGLGMFNSYQVNVWIGSLLVKQVHRSTCQYAKPEVDLYQTGHVGCPKETRTPWETKPKTILAGQF